MASEFSHRGIKLYVYKYSYGRKGEKTSYPNLLLVRDDVSRLNNKFDTAHSSINNIIYIQKYARHKFTRKRENFRRLPFF